MEERAFMQDPIDEEKLLEKYLQENDKQSAIELLFDLIAKNATAKNFSKAEQLREKLFEVDPMALDRIVKSAEIIETEKIAAIDPVHRDIWSHLYKRLTNEEKIAFYYGMKKANYEAEQIVFRQGEMNSNLYFIDAGRLKMFYHKDKHGILLKTIGPGDVAGEDTFFSNSTCDGGFGRQIELFGKNRFAKVERRSAYLGKQTSSVFRKVRIDS